MRPHLPALLHDQTFRRFWLGQTVLLFGDQVSLLAVPLVAVLVLHARPAEMGYLTAAGVLPSLLFSLHAGAWVDRHGHRRTTMLIADLARAGLLASVPTAYALGVLNLPQLYAVAFVIGCFDVLFFVSYSTLFVSIVRTDDYLQGNSLLNGSRALSFVGGQSLAGVLVALLTAPVALLADALSFLVSASFLARIHPQEPPTSKRDRASSPRASASSVTRRSSERPWARQQPSTTSTSFFSPSSCCTRSALSVFAL